MVGLSVLLDLCLPPLLAHEGFSLGGGHRRSNRSVANPLSDEGRV
jgi:hypothetical protein